MDADRENGNNFMPKYAGDGLLPAVIVDAADNAILMVGYMNDEAIRLTRQSGEVHFWSRSRKELWKKGGSSGNILYVEDIQVDCDQDCLLIKARPAGPTCHTGERSCFYRRVTEQGLERL